MSTAGADRMWTIRDAIVAWLYQAKIDSLSPRVIDREALNRALGWDGGPIMEGEIVRDSAYLVDRGLVKASTTLADGTLLFPELTADGEWYAESKRSIRPGTEQEVAPSVSNIWNITNNGPSQMAINSSGFTQNMTVEAENLIAAVADALDTFSAEHPENAETAKELAADLRGAATAPERDGNWIRTLLARAVRVGSAVAGSEVGREVTRLAVEAMQALPM